MDLEERGKGGRGGVWGKGKDTGEHGRGPINQHFCQPANTGHSQRCLPALSTFTRCIYATCVYMDKVLITKQRIWTPPVLMDHYLRTEVTVATALVPSPHQQTYLRVVIVLGGHGERVDAKGMEAGTEGGDTATNVQQGAHVLSPLEIREDLKGEREKRREGERRGSGG